MTDHTQPTTPMHWTTPSGEGPHPAVLLFHEAFGVNDHIRSVADRLATAGFVVGAPHLLSRLGRDVIPYEEHEDAVAVISRLTTSDVLDDARSAHSQLTARDDVDPARVAALGFCFGGRCAFLAATELELRGTVSFYGPGIVSPGPDGPLARAAALQGPVLFIFGELDPLIPDTARDLIGRELDQQGKEHQIITYPLVGHAFFNDARPDRFDEPAAFDAWRQALEFLRAATADPSELS